MFLSQGDNPIKPPQARRESLSVRARYQQTIAQRSVRALRTNSPWVSDPNPPSVRAEHGAVE